MRTGLLVKFGEKTTSVKVTCTYIYIINSVVQCILYLCTLLTVYCRVHILHYLPSQKCIHFQKTRFIRLELLFREYFFYHGIYIGWQTINRCRDLFKAFNQIESIHKLDFSLQKDLFSFKGAQHILSYHLIQAPWYLPTQFSDNRGTRTLYYLKTDMVKANHYFPVFFIHKNS